MILKIITNNLKTTLFEFFVITSNIDFNKKTVPTRIIFWEKSIISEHLLFSADLSKSIILNIFLKKIKKTYLFFLLF